MRYTFHFLAIFLLIVCALQITYADDEMNELKDIMNTSIQYNTKLLEALRKLPENPTDEMISDTKSYINTLFNGSSQKTVQLTKKLYKKGRDFSAFPDYMDTMGDYRQEVLILNDHIKKELRRINSKSKIEIIAIRHEFANPDRLHEDTKKHVIYLSDEIEYTLLKVEATMKQIQDKTSAALNFKQIEGLIGQYRFLSNLLYLYYEDDPEAADPLMQDIQRKYIIINKRIEEEVVRLEGHGYYQMIPLKKLLRAED